MITSCWRTQHCIQRFPIFSHIQFFTLGRCCVVRTVEKRLFKQKPSLLPWTIFPMTSDKFGKPVVQSTRGQKLGTRCQLWACCEWENIPSMSMCVWLYFTVFQHEGGFSVGGSSSLSRSGLAKFLWDFIFILQRRKWHGAFWNVEVLLDLEGVRGKERTNSHDAKAQGCNRMPAIAQGSFTNTGFGAWCSCASYSLLSGCTTSVAFDSSNGRFDTLLHWWRAILLYFGANSANIALDSMS